jgi:hypothetical protein
MEAMVGIKGVDRNWNGWAASTAVESSLLLRPLLLFERRTTMQMQMWMPLMRFLAHTKIILFPIYFSNLACQT